MLAMDGKSYDALTGKQITFGEVFGDGAQALSDFNAKTQAKLDVEFADDVEHPQFDDYSNCNWYLTDSGARVTFDPYVVACFARGFVEIDFDKSELAKTAQKYFH